MQIRKKVFVVTGGGDGIGREVVIGLADAGARVAAVDLSAGGLEETARRARAGSRLSVHTVDVTDRVAVEALPDEVVAVHGEFDGLVNVAGVIHRFAPVGDLTYEEIERVMSVNFWGVVNMVKTFLPGLLERREASLVNVSSMGALAPFPGQGAYGASKAAVKLLTEALYAELRETSVAVTVVFPGAVGTEIAAHSGVTIDMGEGKAAKTTSAPDAAAQIIDAIKRGRYKLRIGSDARMLDRLNRLMPQRAAAVLADKMKGLIES